MPQKLIIRIESTTPTKNLLPWVTINKRGRQSAEAQCFALLGYPEQELSKLDPSKHEDARDTLEAAARLFTAFEYIPNNTETLEQFFEKKVIHFEKRLHDLSSRYPSIHALVGVTSGNKVLFAASGDILIIQATPSQITNLGTTGNATSLHFEAFQTGILQQFSCLIIMPRVMGTLIKSDEFKNLALTGPSHHKLATLEELWKRRGGQGQAFCAMLLQARPKNSTSTESTAASIAHLIDTESQTEELLAPPILKPIIEYSTKLYNRLSAKTSQLYQNQKYNLLQKIKQTKKEHAPAEFLRDLKTRFTRAQAQDSMTSGQHDNIVVLEEEVEIVENDGMVTLEHDNIRTGQQSSMTTEQHDNRTAEQQVVHEPIIAPYLEKIKHQTLQALHNWSKQLQLRLRQSFKTLLRRFKPIERFNRLPLKSKIICICSFTFLFLFIQGMFLTSHYSKVNQAESALQTEIGTITTLIDNASASLIYNDENQARAQTNLARQKIDGLLEFYKGILAQNGLRSFGAGRAIIGNPALENAKTQLSELETKLRHEIVITAPQTTLDTTALLPDTLGLVFKDNIIFNYNARSIAFLKNNILQKLDIPLSSDITLKKIIPHPDAGKLILISNTLAFVYDYTSNTLGSSILIHADTGDAALYQRRLYTIHPNENQIYRYDYTTDTFTAGQAWIKDATPISAATAMTIDGTVYTIDKKGNIIAFLTGKRKDYTLSSVTPAFSNITKIWTDENSSYLYVLEPDNKRLAVFNKKDGLLKAQYTSPTFANLKDFSINERAKTAYILDNTKTISIPLTHF